MVQASPPEKKSAFPIVLVVIVIAVPIVIAVVGVTAVLAIYGVRSYLVQAKMADARAATTQLARGMVACAEASGALPRSSAPVPPAVPSGAKYRNPSATYVLRNELTGDRGYVAGSTPAGGVTPCSATAAPWAPSRSAR